MKKTPDRQFHYSPSYDTDVKKTFERIRRKQRRELEKAALATANVAPITKRAAGRGG